MDNRPTSTKEWLTEVATRGKELSSKRNRRREILISGTTLLIILFTVFSFTAFNSKDTNKNKVIKTVEDIEVTSTTAVPDTTTSTTVVPDIETPQTPSTKIEQNTCYMSLDPACGQLKFIGEIPEYQSPYLVSLEFYEEHNEPANSPVHVKAIVTRPSIIENGLVLGYEQDSTETCVVILIKIIQDGNMITQDYAYACADGTISDLQSGYPLCVMPMVRAAYGTWPAPTSTSKTITADIALLGHSGTHEVSIIGSGCTADKIIASDSYYLSANE